VDHNLPSWVPDDVFGTHRTDESGPVRHLEEDLSIRLEMVTSTHQLTGLVTNFAG
jgi:hypothetical protein